MSSSSSGSRRESLRTLLKDLESAIREEKTCADESIKRKRTDGDTGGEHCVDGDLSNHLIYLSHL